uniref:Similar to 26S proteasome regulatory subunit RPN12 from saccharomyces cerevisiae n=1 Tax=Podospora anserina TaxID=2587412 RepID=Q874V2_PODAS|nr:unnamed protein product [Podospora anserina]
MADRQLTTLLTQLRTPSLPFPQSTTLLSKAKLLLLQLSALTPSPTILPANLTLAREVYELGALHSLRAKNPDSFTRYVSQLQPFYELPPSAFSSPSQNQNKVTALWLLFLLTQGRYTEFHSDLEGLSTRGSVAEVENDKFLGYPIKLERWLMEGAYDRVWKAMKKGEVPSENANINKKVLTPQIRREIASSSERAYPSLPFLSAQSLLFLDSEGAVVDFAHSRGWVIKDRTIYFPTAAELNADEEGEQEQEKEVGQMVIENTLGYARQLETIV